MNSDELRTMVRLSQRRFRSFSEAVDSVLEAIAETTPGVIALGRMEPDAEAHRLTEVRGQGVAGLAAGTVLPAPGGEIDTDFLRSLGARSWLAMPLEMSDGSIVGSLCAVDAAAGAYGPGHAAQLGVAARLLSHDWEGVELRSEVRRLRRRVDAGPGTDPETGLPGREGFLELLDREWRLAERGVVESVLVVCRVGDGSGENGDGTVGASGALALKVTAEVLEGTARVSDRVGRVDGTALGAILVGCKLQDAPAFVSRFLQALARVTEMGRPVVDVSCGVHPLAGASSPEEVLELAAADAAGPVLAAESTPASREGRG